LNIGILLRAYFEYFLDIVVQHIFWWHKCSWMIYILLDNCLRWNKSTRYSVQVHCLIWIL